MLHAICDFCGKDCDRTATLLSMTPFQNFARYHSDNTPYGLQSKRQIMKNVLIIIRIIAVSRKKKLLSCRKEDGLLLS